MRHLMCKFKLITDLEEVPFVDSNDEKLYYQVSTKYDGMFAFWDGGWSRGMLKSSVPFANCNKDKKEEICTGLWSKDGNVLHAPYEWAKHLPERFPCFGELWAGRENYQTVVSTCKKKTPVLEEWEAISYYVFHYPDPEFILRKGSIRYSNKHLIYLEENPIKDVLKEHPKGDWKVHYYHIPHYYVGTPEELQRRWDRLDPLDEGLVVRPMGRWSTSSNFAYAYKIKRKFDCEATVCGWEWGEKRHANRMGSLKVEWRGKRFNIGGGFTDSDREVNIHGGTQLVNFSLGQKITFSYRKLSADGIPMEARFIRVREDS